jgi:hypothetical protein
MDQPAKPQERMLEDALSRALRDNLAPIRRTSDELQQACADLIAACSSSRPSNALPAMLRAQTAAASLASSLAVLSNFITTALQPRERSFAEVTLMRSLEAAQPAARPETPPSPSLPTPMDSTPSIFPPQRTLRVGPLAPSLTMPEPPARVETTIPVAPEPPLRFEPAVSAVLTPEPPLEARVSEPVAADFVVPEIPNDDRVTEITADEWEAAALAVGDVSTGISDEMLGAVADETATFDVTRLPPEEQELHRRANRVAKVAMQDIQLLKPDEVRQGRERRDLCARLRNELDRARKEYDRRFRTILDHPVDYFHHWMVQILANGDAEALGEYPYPTPVLRR